MPRYALADGSGEVDQVENSDAASPVTDNGTGGGKGGDNMDAQLPDFIANSLVAHSHV